MNLIIAVYGPSGCGKTTSIRAMVGEFEEQADVRDLLFLRNDGEIEALLTANGHRVALVSQGDPGTGLEERLRAVVAEGCEVLVCSCRTRGETMWAIQRIAREHSCRIIWTAPYQDLIRDLEVHRNLNGMKARHLVELVLDHVR